MDCCSTVELTSAKSDETLKALGKYILKPGSIIENRPVYTEKESGSHLLFGLDGWKVIPSTPEDNDPPLVSFIHCKPPRESVCPDRCKNDGNWTFFSQAEGKDVPDTERLLALYCHNEKNEIFVILGICLGVVIFVAIFVTVFIVYTRLRKRRNTSRDNADIALPDRKPEDNTFKVEGDEQDPLVDDVEIRNEGIAEETHAPSEPFILQTSHKFLKAKIVVNLTPEYVKSPLDQVITINCDPVAVPKYPYSYDLSFTNSSDNVTTNVDVPQNGKIFFRDIDLQPGDYKYNIVVKGKTDHTELEGWKTELFKIYPGPSVQRQLFGLIPRHYSAVIAKNNVKLWEKSDHIIKNLPKSEILNDTILFRLPELTARNSSLTITTIKPSTVFICQGEEKRAAWNEDTLIQGRYAFCKHNEKVTTSNGDLSIFYANTDPNDNRLVITLPKTAPTNSSISIFVKEIQLNQESPNIKEIEGTCTNDENHPNHSTKNIANNANLINNTNTSSDGDRSGNTNTVSDEDQSVVCFKDFKKSSNGDTIASEQPNHLLEVKKENVDDLESSFEDKDGDWNME